MSSGTMSRVRTQQPPVYMAAFGRAVVRPRAHMHVGYARSEASPAEGAARPDEVLAELRRFLDTYFEGRRLAITVEGGCAVGHRTLGRLP